MKKSLLISSLSVIFIFILSSSKLVLQDNGIAGYTGSPGEQTCTNCHNSFALNSGGGSITIATTPSITASGYVPGATYTVDITVAKTSVSLFGFGTEILTTGNVNAGTISVLNSTQTKLLSSGSKTNIVHQLNGGASSPDAKTFSFKWVAPATALHATIYASGIAANANGSNNGDYVYNTSLNISGSVGIKEEVIDVHLNIYPNPASEIINVSYFLKEDSQVECELTSLTGKIIKHYFTGKQFQGEQNLALPVSDDVSKGLYLLNLKMNTGSLNRRVIIN